MDITVQELKAKIQEKEDFLLLDVREPYEFEEASIEGARLIPLGDIPAAIPDLMDYKDDEIVVQCRSGKRSATAQQILQQAGFTNVRNLEGGIMAWLDANPKV